MFCLLMYTKILGRVCFFNIYCRNNWFSAIHVIILYVL